MSDYKDVKPSVRVSHIIHENKWPITDGFQLMALIMYLDEQYETRGEKQTVDFDKIKIGTVCARCHMQICICAGKQAVCEHEKPEFMGDYDICHKCGMIRNNKWDEIHAEYVNDGDWYIKPSDNTKEDIAKELAECIESILTSPYPIGAANSYAAYSLLKKYKDSYGKN